VIDIDYQVKRPAFWNYDSLNRVRELARFTWNKTPRGFWMVNRYDDVREALQMQDVFTNRYTSALGEPEKKVRLLPQNLNGREHTQLRQVLNLWFSPVNVTRLEKWARSRCIELIEELEPRGQCDLAWEFAMQLPTEVFLAHLGLPTEDGPFFLPLVESMFRGFFGGDPAETRVTVGKLRGYYESVIADRMEHPRDTSSDFVSYLLAARIDGEPLPPDDLLTVCFTIMLAGLDTTRSALGYIFQHLATDEPTRRTLRAHPQMIPTAVEEFLRLYTLLLQDGRYVARDIDFNGCPMKEGDIIWLGLASANRDPRQFERPDDFVIDRQPNRHLAFGAGAHRCLGSHLARVELAMVLEEWLPRIPDFTLDTTEPLEERGGQLMLLHVPLRWTPGPAAPLNDE
jgi:cytochrome P450